MALKIVLLALLVYYCASEAQSQGDIDTSVSYDEIELQGDAATCPTGQLRQETRDNIASNIATLLQDNVAPLLERVQECPCLSEGTRIAYLDMSKPNQQCPPAWTEIPSPVRSCGRTSNQGCDSAIFPANGTAYTQVCGRIRGYQRGNPFAFRIPNLQGGSTSIDIQYIDGVSVTRGTPRQHVWSFVGAVSEDYNENDRRICPCTNSEYFQIANILIPLYVGNDYFCETGTVSGPVLSSSFFAEDPLWDGAGCGPTSTCCEFSNPPWFCKTLPGTTTDDIEVRICGHDPPTFVNTPVDLIEIYVS